MLDPKAVNLIGNGAVVHVPQFFKELKSLQDKGIDTTGRIFISDRAHVLFQLHKLADSLQELSLGDSKVGTTGNGIGPCYSDKAARCGIRIAEILDKDYFDRRLRRLAKKYSNEFGDLLKYDVEREIKDFDEYRETLKPFITDGVQAICDAQSRGDNILVEAANAMCLDIGQQQPLETQS